MVEVVFSREFIAGFQHAAECLGMEGDYHHVDWSQAYEFLKAKGAALPLDSEAEIQRLQREIGERQAQLQFLVCGDPRKGATVPVS